MVKAILFDFDGVLTIDATGSQSICNYVCKETNVDMELFKSEYKKYNNDLLYGKLAHEDIWDKVCGGIGTKISIEILKASFINTPINMDMLELVKKIKCKGYKTAMVTDNKADRIEKITEHFAFEKIFDVIVV
jgi:putative hydrolase of the HAD superfamily